MQFLCHDGTGRVLLHRRGPQARDHRGDWDGGAGGVEFGESLLEAVVREVREEYGLEAIVDEQLLSYTISRENDNHKTHWIGTPFLIRVDGAAQIKKEEGYVDEIGWFAIDTLPEPLHPGLRMVLENFKEALKKHSKT